jgi:DNA-binding NarL/FixJ family response regulator
LDLEVLQLLAGATVERENRSLHGRLTKREQEVLEGVLDGLTNKAIAVGIGVPEGATKAISREIFRKIGVRRRGQATVAVIGPDWLLSSN